MVLNGKASGAGEDRKRKLPLRRQTIAGFAHNQQNVPPVFLREQVSCDITTPPCSKTSVSEDVFEENPAAILDRLDEDFEHRLIEEQQSSKKRVLQEASPSSMNRRKKSRLSSQSAQFSQQEDLVVSISADVMKEKVAELTRQNAEKDQLVFTVRQELKALKEKTLRDETNTFDQSKLMEELETENIALKNVCSYNLVSHRA